MTLWTIKFNERAAVIQADTVNDAIDIYSKDISGDIQEGGFTIDMVTDVICENYKSTRF